MLYLIAILCPPLAVLLTGRLFTAIFTFFLTFLGYFPGAIVALLVVSDHNSGQRHKEMVRLTRKGQQSDDRRFAAQSGQNRLMYEAQLRQAHAAEYQAKAADQMLRMQREALQGPTPPPLPAPNYVIDIDDDGSDQSQPTPEPAMPIGERVRLVAGQAKAAYDTLPEWGQPVIWGMAAATPAVMIMFAIWLLR